MNIDILANRSDQSPFFTVDLAEDFVELQSRDFLSTWLQTAGGLNAFTWRDNIEMLSYGWNMPLGFEWYESQDSIFATNKKLMEVQIAYEGNIGNRIFPTEFNDLWLPQAENYEMALNQFMNLPDTLEPSVGFDHFFLTANIPSVNIPMISMVNVPDDLDGVKFYTPFWVKVKHTIPLRDITPPSPT